MHIAKQLSEGTQVYHGDVIIEGNHYSYILTLDENKTIKDFKAFRIVRGWIDTISNGQQQKVLQEVRKGY